MRSLLRSKRLWIFLSLGLIAGGWAYVYKYVWVHSRVCDTVSPYEAGIVYGPQVALPTPTSIVIAYKTKVACRGAVEVSGPNDWTRVFEGDADAHRHEVAVAGLSPATDYTYRIRVGDAFSDRTHPFRTPADGGDTLRFVVMGDSGSGCAAQYRVAYQMQLAAPEIVVSVGDVAYKHGTADEVRTRYFYPYATLVDRIPFFIAMGNHDVERDGGRPLLDALVLPTNDRNGSERFYSIDRGPCHFAFLDSNVSLEDSGQVEWLTEDLARSQARWKFVVLHNPVYSTSVWGTNETLVDLLCPVFEANGVDMVFSGHEHTYMRSRPILEGEVVDEGHRVTYVITGGGGGSRIDPVSDGPIVASCKAVHHFVLIEIDGGTLTYRTIDAAGETIDETSITK